MAEAQGDQSLVECISKAVSDFLEPNIEIAYPDSDEEKVVACHVSGCRASSGCTDIFDSEESSNPLSQVNQLQPCAKVPTPLDSMEGSDEPVPRQRGYRSPWHGRKKNILEKRAALAASRTSKKNHCAMSSAALVFLTLRSLQRHLPKQHIPSSTCCTS